MDDRVESRKIQHSFEVEIRNHRVSRLTLGEHIQDRCQAGPQVLDQGRVDIACFFGIGQEHIGFNASGILTRHISTADRAAQPDMVGGEGETIE